MTLEVDDWVSQIWEQGLKLPPNLGLQELPCFPTTQLTLNPPIIENLKQLLDFLGSQVQCYFVISVEKTSSTC